MDEATLELLRSQTLAGWFQAVGSVAAIFISVWLSERAATRAARRSLDGQRDNIQGLLQSIINFAEGTSTSVKKAGVKGSAGWGRMMRASRTAMSHFIRALANTDVVRLERPFLWNNWALLLQAMELLGEQFDEEAEWARTRSSGETPIEDRKEDVLNRLKTVIEDATSAQKALAGQESLPENEEESAK